MAACATGSLMIDPSITWHVHRRHCTGNAVLFSNLENPPINNSLMASTRAHTCPLMDQVKASDPHRNRREGFNSINNSSNPHSVAATSGPMLPRPRGFLP